MSQNPSFVTAAISAVVVVLAGLISSVFYICIVIFLEPKPSGSVISHGQFATLVLAPFAGILGSLIAIEASICFIQINDRIMKMIFTFSMLVASFLAATVVGYLIINSKTGMGSAQAIVLFSPIVLESIAAILIALLMLFQSLPASKSDLRQAD